MGNTLKIKRGTNATIPQGQLAEPLFTTDTYDLYIGKGAGGNQRIQNYIASGTSSQFLKGDGSLDSTTYQATSEKGQNNGYASLDAGGKIPAAQLPSSVIEYKGTWNASTNTPTLADGTGDAGDVYIVSVGGTQNLGSGAITFAAGDWVMYNGSIWQKSTGSNAVASVNGQTGIVSIGVNDLDDTTITSPSNGQLLQYSTGTNKWVNWTPNYVPYTGATADVDLGFNNFDANQINGFQIVAKLNGTGSSPLILKTGTSGYSYGSDAISLISSPTSANTLTIISDVSSVNKIAQFGLGSLTATRTYTLPDATGTLALTSNIPANIITGTGTNNEIAYFNTTGSTIASLSTATYPSLTELSYVKGVTSAIQTQLDGKQAQLNGTGFVKASGTTISYDNSTYLTTSSAASTYLPLTGGTLTGALIGTTASFTSNSGNFNLGSQTDTAIYTHFGSKSASGGQAVAMRLAGTLTATANFDNLFGLWVDYTDNAAGYTGVVRYGIYQNDSGKRNYFGGPTTFNSVVTVADTATATAFIPTGTSVPSRGMYTSASNVLDFSAGTTNLLSLNYNTGLSTFNTGVKGSYFRIVNVSTAEFGINTENNQGYIGTTTSHGFNIMTNNTPRLEFHATTGAATFSSSVGVGGAAVSSYLTGSFAVNASGDNYVSIVSPSANAAGLMFQDITGTSIVGGVRYTHSDDTLSLWTNGGSRLSISSTGTATFASGGNRNVLISNDSVDTGYSIISLNGTRTKGSYAGIAGGGTGDDNLYINSGSSVVIQTGASYTSRLTISSTGAATFSAPVTISPVNQTSFLTINSSSSLYQSTIYFREGGSNRWELTKSVTTPDLDFYSYGTSSSVLTLKYSSGNVGIGTTSPGSKLDVYTGTGATLRVTSGGTNILNVGNYSAADGFREFLLVGSELSFYTGTAGGGSASERMRIASNGNVSIAGDLALTPNDSAITFSSGAGRFFTGGAERMRITSGGNVGIGTTGSSTIRLVVCGSGTSSAADSFQAADVNGNTLFRVRNDGNIFSPGIYNNTSAGGTQVNVDSSGNLFRFSSSLRYKKDITNYDKGLNYVSKIKPVYFKSINANTNDKQFAGLIAEQLDEIGLNEFVEYNDNKEPDSIHYQNMVALLTKAIQELKQELDILKNK